MSVSQSDLLSLAKEIAARAKTEVEFRAAISRAYYAAFHCARSFQSALPSIGRQPPKPTGVHDELAFRLSWPTIPDSDPRFQKSRDIGRSLRWLHDKRIKADYELSMNMEAPDALEVINRAEKLIALAR